MFFFCKLIAVCAAFASDASGGVFYPSLTMGAALGAFVNQVAKWTYMNYADPAREERVLDSGRYFLITVFGMIGAFAAIVRAPISGVVIVYEMTNVGKTRNDLIFPSLFTAVIAYIVSTEMQEKDVYEIVLERTGLYDLSEELQDMEDAEAEEAAAMSPTAGSTPDDGTGGGDGGGGADGGDSPLPTPTHSASVERAAQRQSARVSAFGGFGGRKSVQTTP